MVSSSSGSLAREKRSPPVEVGLDKRVRRKVVIDVMSVLGKSCRSATFRFGA